MRMEDEVVRRRLELCECLCACIRYLTQSQLLGTPWCHFVHCAVLRDLADSERIDR